MNTCRPPSYRWTRTIFRHPCESSPASPFFLRHCEHRQQWRRRLLRRRSTHAYADGARDLSLTVDGSRVQPKLVSVGFPQAELMREGLGEIHIEFTADLPPGGRNRRLILQNNHQDGNAAYLMNCLVPRDPDIRIVAQNRNERQSFYQLDYVQAGGSSGSPLRQWWTNVRGSISALRFHQHLPSRHAAHR